MLKGKKILLGVTGSIAAYKTATLVRVLTKAGADVRVVLTPSALSFVTPLTLSTLSKHPVHSAYVENEETGEWANHVALGKWADLMVIAPCSANTLSKLVSGECDNLLIAVYLSASCPIMVAPAMDLDMSDHWTTKKNLETLEEKHVRVLPFGEGELASGLTGKGRMMEPEEIFDAIADHFDPRSKLKGKRILITAGPTYEAIDPVRYIGNHSSGKMGFALAQAAADRGADVHLVSGPTHLQHDPMVHRYDVVSAKDMFEKVTTLFKDTDVLIMSAAVADYRPATIAEKKLKKEVVDLAVIELEKTEDILAHCGAIKEKQLLVGFALETDDELAHARRKLENKNLDLLVLNSLRDAGAGFGTDTNKVTFVFPDQVREGELKLKTEVAADILDEIERML
ncbi:MAG: bifunctional phosphopantothenoylcysteine decarboxylase/phosphopantothenate--cysteine ligase CoaBC [Flavobacteriales bacterium]|nr:bifunctional phosphopantothenoylcysteine decarboxylase/phosphopantothenate--cysteine ligase CoaBC [Flavobacteriales bacterium]